MLPIFEAHLYFCLFHNQTNPSYQIEATTSETRDRVQTSPKMNGVGESVFVVDVDKSSGSLGLTLEGGSDAGGDVKIKSIKVRRVCLVIEASDLPRSPTI